MDWLTDLPAGGKMSIGIESVNKVKVIEADGKEVPFRSPVILTVLSHWNVGRWVVIEAGDHRYTVAASELGRAVRNASE